MVHEEDSLDSNSIIDILCEVVTTCGISILDEPKKVKGLLSDYSYGENQRDIRILVTLLEEKIPHDLLSGQDTIPYDILFNNAATKISQYHPVDKSSLQWAINCWAFALGIINEPPLYGPESFELPNNLQNNEEIAQLIQVLRCDPNDLKRNQAAREIKKYNIPRVIDALIESANNDEKVRFEALSSLYDMKSKKALELFKFHLTDPSPRIRRVSILALNDFGDESVIELLESIVVEQDFRYRNKGKQKNWGKYENVKLAEDAINSIRSRAGVHPPRKTFPEMTHYVKSGMEYNESKEFSKAVREFDKEIRNNPNNSIAIREKGFALSNLGQYDVALNLLSRAIKLDPGDSIAWRHKGYIFSRQRKDYEALNCYDAAIKIDPNDSATWRTKGYSLHRIKKYHEALECYKKAIELNKDEFINWFLASKVFRDVHQYENEIHFLKKAFQIDNTALYCLASIGWAHVNMNQFQEGLHYFEHVLNLDRDNQSAWKGRSFCLNKLSYQRRENINPNPTTKNEKNEGIINKIFPFLKKE